MSKKCGHDDCDENDSYRYSDFQKDVPRKQLLDWNLFIVNLVSQYDSLAMVSHVVIGIMDYTRIGTFYSEIWIGRW